MKKGPILIIDDDGSTLIITSQFLKTKGYEVVTANNAEDGIKLFKEKPPALIIVDLMFEGHEVGIQIIKDIKKINPEAMFILITVRLS